MPFRQGCDLMSTLSQVGERWTMKNGYSLLLFPTESLKQPWMLCGTRSKKKKSWTKYFCTQLITIYILQSMTKTKSIKGLSKEMPYPKELGFLVTLHMTVLGQLLALHVPKQLNNHPRSYSTHPCLSGPLSVLLFWLDHFSVFPES